MKKFSSSSISGFSFGFSVKLYNLREKANEEEKKEEEQKHQ